MLQALRIRWACLRATLGLDGLNPSTLTHPWRGWHGFMWGRWVPPDPAEEIVMKGGRCVALPLEAPRGRFTVDLWPVRLRGEIWYWKPTPRRWLPPRSQWRATWRNLVYELVLRPRYRRQQEMA